MRVWLMTVGEPLPLAGARDRLWRTGLLAHELCARGHEVLWWTSTVDHFRKELFVAGEPCVKVEPGLRIRFLSGRLYKRNISLDRLINHAQIARRFAALAAAEQKPDVILCSFPTIELSRAAVEYGRAAGVPVILDVRDLWPDILLDVLPAPVRTVGRFALASLFHDTKWSLRRCAGVFAVSDGYLNWGLDRAGRERRASDVVFPLGYQATPWTAADEHTVQQRLASAGLSVGQVLATFVGTFGRTYDLQTVIRAARSFADAGNTQLGFVFCGEGERGTQWRQASEGLRNVAFTGWLSAGELSYLLSRSSIGLAAYAAGAPQGIPNKVIEYLSAGLPVLCSLQGESRLFLEKHSCGLAYDADDPASLTASLESLLHDRERRVRMGLAARAVFEREFSAAAVYGAMADKLEWFDRMHRSEEAALPCSA
jgi:glycosyltransferase involved in cell wall biosynthesis